MREFFPKPNFLRANVKVKLDLSNYACNKNRFKKCNRSWYIIFCLKKVDLASLKSNVDKLEIDKLKNVPSGLRSLKSKVDKLDIDKVVFFSADLS